ncbi:hypothetical protein HN51_047646 [Arachis hypogaea]
MESSRVRDCCAWREGETTPLALSWIADAVQATTRGERRCVKGGDERSRTRTGRRRARRLEGGSAAAVAARASRWNSWSLLVSQLCPSY